MVWYLYLAAVVMATRSTLQPEDLRLEEGRKPAAAAAQLVVPEGMTLEQVEKEVLAQRLRACDGNRTLVADQLGISRRTIQRKIKDYGLPY